MCSIEKSFCRPTNATVFRAKYILMAFLTHFIFNKNLILETNLIKQKKLNFVKQRLWLAFLKQKTKRKLK